MTVRRFLTGGIIPLVATGTALSAEAASGEAEGGLPQFDLSTFASQIFWLLIAFVVLYLLVSRQFLPRIGGVIEERRQRIADDFDKAAEFKRQAEEAEASYKQALADARARASRITQDTRDQIDAEIRKMQTETDNKLAGEIAAAEARIAETSAKAAETVRQAARDTTREVVMALIDETPSDDAVDAALKTAHGGSA